MHDVAKSLRELGASADTYVLDVTDRAEVEKLYAAVARDYGSVDVSI